ncbi:Polypyrimidine tract-binding protein 2 [Hypsibius exemplaris]|uniref:Polypyrimidine tract-binding protein 2 n=1 Tax=Hypsibius exemplaris TaxID=2072580 RepID=A0A1W0X2M8_HYPEX|nr:Polypyrimidine tract-binding protein 2 [Hypsibius exemplaris]
MSKRNWEDLNEAENMNGNGSSDTTTTNGIHNHSPSGSGGGGSSGGEGDQLKKVKLDDNIGKFHNENGGGAGSSSTGSGSNGSPITVSNGSHSNGRERRNSLPSSGAHHNNNPPSRVVHIRGIANEIHETEIAALGLPFGRTSNVLLLKGKNQAFLEMADESAAIQMVNFYNSGHPCMIKGKNCWVQFSSHKELRTDNFNSNNSVKAQSVLRSALPVLMAQQCMGMGLIPDGSVLQSHVPYGNGGGNGGGLNTILRVVVDNALYPVSLDVLHGIFSRFGKVLKIIIFTKNNQFQALIQYPDRNSATMAKQSLDGQNIYTGCCTLRIDYSRMDQLRVTYNNDKSRDYLNPNLPSGDSQGVMMYTDNLRQLQASMMQGQQQPLMHAFGGGNSNGNGNMMNDLLQSGNGFNASMLQSAFGRQGFMGQSNSANSVMLVSKFDEELVTPDVLFILFGVYGDVMRVKILFNKKDTALVQMSEPRGAQLAILHLDRVKLFGKQIRVTASRHTDVQMPKEGQPDSGLTRDFTNSPLHRFKKPGSKNFQNIFPPADTLHLSNIPPDVSEEDISRYFQEAGFNVRQCKFFPKDRKMALVQVASAEEGVEALIKMHNFQLNKNTHLRVSFSKTNIREQQ